jgi:hypothetical protein
MTIPVEVGMRETKVDEIDIRVILEVHIVLARDQHVIRFDIAVDEAQFMKSFQLVNLKELPVSMF